MLEYDECCPFSFAVNLLGDPMGSLSWNLEVMNSCTIFRGFDLLAIRILLGLMTNVFPASVAEWLRRWS